MYMGYQYVDKQIWYAVLPPCIKLGIVMGTPNIPHQNVTDMTWDGVDCGRLWLNYMHHKIGTKFHLRKICGRENMYSSSVYSINIGQKVLCWICYVCAVIVIVELCIRRGRESQSVLKWMNKTKQLFLIYKQMSNILSLTSLYQNIQRPAM